MGCGADDSGRAITVERLEDGEVSPYLVGELKVGDKLELRGPIGGYFVWKAGELRSLLLIAGGSGIVPLMAMIRHRALVGDKAPARLLYSSRAVEDIIYREELDRLAPAGDRFPGAHNPTPPQRTGWLAHSRGIGGGTV